MTLCDPFPRARHPHPRTATHAIATVIFPPLWHGVSIPLTGQQAVCIVRGYQVARRNRLNAPEERPIRAVQRCA